MLFRIMLFFAVCCSATFTVAAQWQVKRNASTVQFQTAQGVWSITPYPNAVVKFAFQPIGYTTNEAVADAIITQPNSNDVPKIFETPNQLTIKYADATITYTAKDGFRINNQVQLLGYHADATYKGFQLALANDEKIYGGGQRALPLNRVGYQLKLYNNPWYGYANGADNLNYSVPYFQSSKGYGVLFNNGSKGYVDIGKQQKNVFEYGAVSGELNCFVFLAKSQQQLLKNYYASTGVQPMLPKWAAGNFLSRFGYLNEVQAKQIAAGMRQQQIPFDAIIFDLFWFGDSIKNTLGNLDWVNQKAWPNPKQMIADFKANNVQTILITEPFILEGTKNYEAGKGYLAINDQLQPYRLTNFYFGYGGIVDVFRNDSKDWFWSFYQKQMDMNGVTGWWGDLGEPENHPADAKHQLRDKGFQRLFSADEIHNLYGHEWTKMLYEKFATHYPKKRLFSLNRAGFAGTQRYGILPWSGDISRSWSGYQAQLPVMLGAAMSGLPYYHSDAGGFAGGENDAELYVRWLQMAAFSPIFRPHGTALYEADKQAFSYPSEPSLQPAPYNAYARKIVLQRYQYLPYTYNLSYLHATKAQPLMSPLYYYFENDTAAQRIEDAYMWGSDMLVAPMLQKAATERRVYLPQGTQWYVLGDDQAIAGGTSITASAPIDSMPVFVREGAFVPSLNMNRNINTTKDALLNTFEMHYYATNKASSGFVYDDDGETKDAALTQQFEKINFAAQPMKTTCTINVFSEGKGYAAKPQRRLIHLYIHGGKYKKAVVQGKSVSMRFSKGVGIVSFTYSGKPMRITLQ